MVSELVGESNHSSGSLISNLDPGSRSGMTLGIQISRIQIMARVFLTKDIEKIGFAGEIIKVKEGFATNYLVPNKLGILVTATNEKSLAKKIKSFENRKEAVASKTSMLAEKIKSLKLTLKRKMHNDDQLYGAISASDIVDLLAQEGIKVAKNQILLNKAIKTKGTFDITIKLSNNLQPSLKLKVQPE